MHQLVSLLSYRVELRNIGSSYRLLICTRLLLWRIERFLCFGVGESRLRLLLRRLDRLHTSRSLLRRLFTFRSNLSFLALLCGRGLLLWESRFLFSLALLLACCGG